MQTPIHTPVKVSLGHIPSPTPDHTLRRAVRRAARALTYRLWTGLAAGAMALCLTACQKPPQDWKLTDVSGHMPDLQFSLTSDTGAPITEAAFKGDITLVFFGYTHCPDVCPETMARLSQVIQQLGPKADHVRIAFISVDPHRDTPAMLHAYVRAFDPQHAQGMTGSDQAIAALARRYRVAYELGKPGPDGNYEVDHSAAIYIFDGQSHIRLMATDNDSAEVLVHDLRLLIADAA
jgi:protein SCO1